MDTKAMTPLEIAQAKEIVEAATPEELLEARERAQQELLEATRVSETTTELRFELSQKLHEVQDNGTESDPTLQRIVTETLFASRIAELEETQEGSAVSPEQIREKIRDEIGRVETAT